uniref:Transposase n=1 Tax=Arundo donax TaxID=35708 RepID=A0A0A8XQ05_ARUDO
MVWILHKYVRGQTTMAQEFNRDASLIYQLGLVNQADKLPAVTTSFMPV